MNVYILINIFQVPGHHVESNYQGHQYNIIQYYSEHLNFNIVRTQHEEPLMVLMLTNFAPMG